MKNSKQRLNKENETNDISKGERKTIYGLTMKEVTAKVLEDSMLSDEVMDKIGITRQTLMKIPWSFLPYIIKTFNDGSPRRVYPRELVIEYFSEITERKLKQVEDMKKDRSKFIAA
jgi:hypothetical protein